MEDYSLALMSGVDLPIIECQLIIHQPTVREISMIGEVNFFSGAQCLCVDRSSIKELQEDKNLSTAITNFQIFMMIMQEKETLQKKEDVLAVLSLILPNYKIMITPRALLLNSNDTNITIDEGNFIFFQNVLRQVFCMDRNEEEEFNPIDERARAIAEKIKKGRARIAALKGSNTGSLLARYVSSLTVGIRSMSLSDLLDCTFYQITDLINRYSLYTN